MTSYSYPNFDDFEELLEKHELMVNPSEVHGLITGMFAGGMASKDEWLSNINDMINDGQGLPADVKREMGQLHLATFQGLSDSLLSFQLLMPDDDYSPEERAEAIAQWVQSFLVGFGLMQSDLSKLAEDVQELIHDFSEISKLSPELEGSEEDNEQALFQVVEYVRIGAVTIFAHLNEPESGDGEEPTLH
ncbi:MULTISPECIES: UPF0149 family protein [Aliagarivorans]|uniref:UPF0149 family protein n=1 Tax=Aliagarivorans TaxID=882379 RepID=UPI0004036A6D|nr:MULTISPECIES: UPF0149 family protein [Aliagarivorans]